MVLNFYLRNIMFEFGNQCSCLISSNLWKVINEGFFHNIVGKSSGCMSTIYVGNVSAKILRDIWLRFLISWRFGLVLTWFYQLFWSCFHLFWDQVGNTKETPNGGSQEQPHFPVEEGLGQVSMDPQNLWEREEVTWFPRWLWILTCSWVSWRDPLFSITNWAIAAWTPRQPIKNTKNQWQYTNQCTKYKKILLTKSVTFLSMFIWAPIISLESRSVRCLCSIRRCNCIIGWEYNSNFV